MATITRFEDLKAWQAARKFAREFFVISHEREAARDFAVANQMRSAGLSPMSNIAEGFGRRTDKEFIAFLSHAHGSVAECQSLLYVLLDEGIIQSDAFDRLYRRAEDVSRLIQGLANYLTGRAGRRSTRRRIPAPTFEAELQDSDRISTLGLPDRSQTLGHPDSPTAGPTPRLPTPRPTPRLPDS